MNDSNPLQIALQNQILERPESLSSLLEVEFKEKEALALPSHIQELFPHTSNGNVLKLEAGSGKSHPLCVGVVFSGGQAPGGHNVLYGLHEALKKNHPGSKLLGFLNGPSGLLEEHYVELTQDLLENYKNLGGFDCLGSGRTKIQTDEQFKQALASAKALKLDAFVIIGGDDSNTNVALLAEYFKKEKQPTSVIGVPKTIDGDLKNNYVEVSFGYDTACRVYSELIGNIEIDARSAKKYYHFVKLMGRSASHIALECALSTHPNLVFIGEEVSEKKRSLSDLVDEIVDLIVQRSQEGKNYGVVLIPEGLIDFIPELSPLNQSLNHLLSKEPHLSPEEIAQKLSPEHKKTYCELPLNIQEQLLLERDPHGNIQLAKIDTQSLLMEMTQTELKKRSDYSGKFSPVSHYLGYEGRCSHPSPFDAQYTYVLGYCAALLAIGGHTGYMACVKNLSEDYATWELFALPITTLLKLEIRHGKEKPVIEKALVNLKGSAYLSYLEKKEGWRLGDHYSSPGPIQYFGPKAVIQSKNWLMKALP